MVRKLDEISTFNEYSYVFPNGNKKCHFAECQPSLADITPFYIHPFKGFKPLKGFIIMVTFFQIGKKVFFVPASRPTSKDIIVFSLKNLSHIFTSKQLKSFFIILLFYVDAMLLCCC